MAALASTSELVSLDGFARLAALGSRRTFANGEQLMRQGEEAATLYLILSGEVTVVREHAALSMPVVLASLGPGEVVGEMGLLDGDRRSATVTAAEDTVTAEVGADDVARIVAEHPQIYGALVKVLARRLRKTDELTAEIASGGS